MQFTAGAEPSADGSMASGATIGAKVAAFAIYHTSTSYLVLCLMFVNKRTRNIFNMRNTILGFLESPRD